MKTATELKAKTIAILTRDGMAVNEEIAESVTKAGFEAIENGTVIYEYAGQLVKLENGFAVCYKDGVEVKRTAVDDTAKESILIQYAIKLSKKHKQKESNKMKITKKSPEALWKESLDDVSFCINEYEYAKHYLRSDFTVPSWAMEDFVNRTKDLRKALIRCERMLNNIKELQK